MTAYRPPLLVRWLMKRWAGTLSDHELKQLRIYCIVLMLKMKQQRGEH